MQIIMEIPNFNKIVKVLYSIQFSLFASSSSASLFSSDEMLRASTDEATSAITLRRSSSRSASTSESMSATISTSTRLMAYIIHIIVYYTNGK